MTFAERKARFRLIRKPEGEPLLERSFAEPSGQGLLFPVSKSHLLVFMVFPFVTEREFTETLEVTRPSRILELRRHPRFDIGSLNRQKAFHRFDAASSRYHDLADPFPTGIPGASGDPIRMVEAFLREIPAPVCGPIMLLVSDPVIKQASEEGTVLARIARLFSGVSKQPWDTLCIPQAG